MTTKQIYIASDHRGMKLKKLLLGVIEASDRGPFNDESVDYPVYARKVADVIAIEPDHRRGILICGSGIGVAMAANKIPGIRAATCRTVADAVGTRLHNDANIVCIGADVTNPNDAFDIVQAFLTTEFEGGRHQIRVDLIEFSRYNRGTVPK